jgi:two-component system, NtrC family, nitrogen regulation sensor histidine kinase NtrY
MTDPQKLPTKRSKLSFERRLALLTLMAGFPATAVAAWLLWNTGLSLPTRLSLSLVLLGWWLCLTLAVRQKIRFPLQTLANLLAGMREGDFSTRARGSNRDDALGELVIEVNTLADTLRQQRLGAMEATSLLRTVMTEIEVAVFTFDDAQRLQLVNRAGERLLARPLEQLLGRTAPELSLGDLVKGEPARTVQRTFPGGSGRWGMRRTSFRQEGRQRQLLVLTDLSRALRDEERQAWQRLVRVIGHELNNSLAPIKSIAGTMETMLSKKPRPEDWESDLQNGLSIIASRADSLSRFMEAYARLARLPPPRLQPLSAGASIRQVAALETRLKVEVEAGPEITIRADGDQLGQLLINLIRNATDATLEAGNNNGVKVTWSKAGDSLEVCVQDEGPGLSNSANLFVPFFTTKPAGSGIGLVLCRQIAEAHGGALTLENRKTGRGCEARLRLPA